MKTIIFIFLAISLASFSQAQSKYNSADYTTQPSWIIMMDDTNANYYEAIAAFEAYWANHKKPEGESDMDMKQVAKNKKRFSKREIKEARAEASMRMQIKKFEWWKMKMEPYVQEDGRLLMPAERLQLLQTK
jgi:hypothetical protein